LIPSHPSGDDWTSIEEEEISEEGHQTTSSTVQQPSTTMEKDGNALNGDTRQDYKLVSFVDGDPGNPKNWSKPFKWYITMVVAITCFVVAFCSSVITSDIGGVSESFGVSHEVALVPISVFVVGFGVGELPSLQGML
jgi:hypothetical protein